MERSQNAARMREAELTDRILSMKGYREFAPVWQGQTVEEPTPPDWDETSIYEQDGFQPLT